MLDFQPAIGNWSCHVISPPEAPDNQETLCGIGGGNVWSWQHVAIAQKKKRGHEPEPFTSCFFCPWRIVILWSPLFMLYMLCHFKISDVTRTCHLDHYLCRRNSWDLRSFWAPGGAIWEFSGVQSLMVTLMYLTYVLYVEYGWDIWDQVILRKLSGSSRRFQLVIPPQCKRCHWCHWIAIPRRFSGSWLRG